MAADYIYENRGSGGTHDTPTKSHVGWVSDLADAAQYLSLGLLRIISDREEDVRPTRDEDIDWYA